MGSPTGYRRGTGETREVGKREGGRETEVA